MTASVASFRRQVSGFLLLQVLAGALALVWLVGAAYGCSRGSPDGPGLPEAAAVASAAAPATLADAAALPLVPTRDAALSEVVGRLVASIDKVEQVRAAGEVGDVGPLALRREVLLGWQFAQAGPAPADPAQARLLAARQRATAARLTDLTQASQEQALRGSVDFYRASAEMDWDYGYARDLANRLGLPTDTVPENGFQLLPPERVRAIRRQWLDTLHTLSRRQVMATPGAYAPAIDRARRQLSALDDALAKGQVDLRARFDAVPDVMFAGVASWVAEQRGAREAQVALRTQQLLHEALARDGGDLSVLGRLAELRGGEAWAEQARVESFEYVGQWTEPTRSRLALDIIRDRLVDPLRAAWNEARLMHLASSENLGETFPEFLAYQLNDGDLAEASTWLERTHRMLEEVQATTPAALLRRDVDLRALAAEHLAVSRRLAQGGSGPTEGPATAAPTRSLRPSDPGLASFEPPTDLSRVPWSLRQRYYESLRRLAARTEVAVVVEQKTDEVAMSGYADEVSDLERDVARVKNAATRAARAARPRSLEVDWKQTAAAEALFRRAGALYRGVQQYSAPNSVGAQALLDRIRAVDPHAGLKSYAELRDEILSGEHSAPKPESDPSLWRPWERPIRDLEAELQWTILPRSELDHMDLEFRDALLAKGEVARPFMDPALVRSRVEFERALEHLEPPPPLELVPGLLPVRPPSVEGPSEAESKGGLGEEVLSIGEWLVKHPRE